MNLKEVCENETRKDPWFQDELHGGYGLTQDYGKWLETKIMKAETKIMKPPKFNDWLSENFTKVTKHYYNENTNNETYSIKEIESKYIMKFRTNP